MTTMPTLTTTIPTLMVTTTIRIIIVRKVIITVITQGSINQEGPSQEGVISGGAGVAHMVGLAGMASTDVVGSADMVLAGRSGVASVAMLAAPVVLACIKAADRGVAAQADLKVAD